jgi:hypothetical protein
MYTKTASITNKSLNENERNKIFDSKHTLFYQTLLLKRTGADGPVASTQGNNPFDCSYDVVFHIACFYTTTLAANSCCIVLVFLFLLQIMIPIALNKTAPTTPPTTHPADVPVVL